MALMGAEYQFVDTWFVPGASPEEVYDVIGDPPSYPRWWGRVFLEATGDAGPPRPGQRASVVTKGFLPYKLRYQSEMVETERPRRLRMVVSGDFGGGGEWTIEPVEGGTQAQLDWRPVVEKPLVRNLTPLLRPLFRKNHFWAMDRGQEGILAEVERRRHSSQS